VWSYIEATSAILELKESGGGDAKHLVQVELFAEYYGYDGDGCKYCVSLA
jgi:hypothetical protein